MAKFDLQETPRLGGYTKEFGDSGMVLREITELVLTSLAMPMGGKTKLTAAVKDTFGLTLPTALKSKLSTDGQTRLVQTQPDQYFCLTSKPVPSAMASVAYVTDQTHGWVGLDISGPNVREALERICPVDLDPSAFPVHAAARTTMEHLGVLIIRVSKDQFCLLSASSSAESFLHAVELSIKNVI